MGGFLGGKNAWLRDKYKESNISKIGYQFRERGYLTYILQIQFVYDKFV